MDRKSMAVEFKHNGCNCAQAVVLAFADLTGMNTDEAMVAGSAFGMGMGCTKATCGPAIGAGIVLGTLFYGKAPVTSKAKQMLLKFEEKCGAVTCADLKGIGTGKILCSCDDCVSNAVEILEQIIDPA